MQLVSLRSPWDVWATEPTLLVMEVATWLIFVCLAIHAVRSGGRHVCLLLLGAIGGAVLDPFCLLSPEVNNYWHSQAMVMLYNYREPFYQTPLIANVPYICIALAWELPLHRFSTILSSIFAGSFAVFTWHICDVVGVQMVWWTWHVHDPLYEERSSGVPVASSFWMFAWTLALALVVQATAPLLCRMPRLLAVPAVALLGGVGMPIAQTLVFMVYYHPMIQVAGLSAATTTLAAQAAGAAVGAVNLALLARGQPPGAGGDRKAPGCGRALLYLALAVWFGSLLAVATLSDAGLVRTHSIRQPFGGEAGALCNATELYQFGSMTRRRHVCLPDFAAAGHVWRLCGQPPEVGGSDWYGLCGVTQTHAWVVECWTSAGVAIGLHALVLACIVVAGAAAGSAPRVAGKRKQKRK
mmetsp:Transcript_3746/g.9125  ORF Transcript_3746/g.9125 Transcript_3746/m.9125 type:complete len:411 (-) Transcript_3746:65-1297(-)